MYLELRVVPVRRGDWGDEADGCTASRSLEPSASTQDNSCWERELLEKGLLGEGVAGRDSCCERRMIFLFIHSAMMLTLFSRCRMQDQNVLWVLSLSSYSYDKHEVSTDVVVLIFSDKMEGSIVSLCCSTNPANQLGPFISTYSTWPGQLFLQLCADRCPFNATIYLPCHVCIYYCIYSLIYLLLCIQMIKTLTLARSPGLSSIRYVFFSPLFLLIF